MRASALRTATHAHVHPGPHHPLMCVSSEGQRHRRSSAQIESRGLSAQTIAQAVPLMQSKASAPAMESRTCTDELSSRQGQA